MKYKYPFTNAIVFALVMRDPKICKGLLQMIFPERVIENVRLHEEYLNTEQTVIAAVESRKVRLDVLFRDDEAWYDIEMQVRDEKNLAKRSRYAHGIMDVNALKPAQDFNELKPCYVIFLCCFDPFSINAPVYSFRMFDERNWLPLEDHSNTIILNSRAPADKTPQALRELYEYMNDSTVAEENAFLREIDNGVESWNNGEGVRVIMTLEQEMLIREERVRKEAREEGRQEGAASTAREIALRLLRNGMKPSEVSESTGLSEADVAELM